MSRETHAATALGQGHPLAALDLAHACGAGLDWVVQLVEVGVVQVSEPASRPEEWRFESIDLQCALTVRRLERDFGVDLDAAALILDLQREVRRLRSLLVAHGLERELRRGDAGG